MMLLDMQRRGINSKDKDVPAGVIAERKEVGERIKTLLRQKRVSQGVVARWLGVEQSTVSNYLNGYRPMTMDAASILCRRLKVGVGELFGEAARSDGRPVLSLDDEITDRERRFCQRLLDVAQIELRALRGAVPDAPHNLVLTDTSLPPKLRYEREEQGVAVAAFDGTTPNLTEESQAQILSAVNEAESEESTLGERADKGDEDIEE